jgi:hypothetical protein
MAGCDEPQSDISIKYSVLCESAQVSNPTPRTTRISDDAEMGVLL